MRAQTDKSLLTPGCYLRLSQPGCPVSRLALCPDPPKLTAVCCEPCGGEDPAHRCPLENNSPHSEHICVFIAVKRLVWWCVHTHIVVFWPDIVSAAWMKMYFYSSDLYFQLSFLSFFFFFFWALVISLYIRFLWMWLQIFTGLQVKGQGHIISVILI